MPEPGQVDVAIDMKTSVLEQVDALAAAYFKLFGELSKINPPAAAAAGRQLEDSRGQGGVVAQHPCHRGV